MARQSPAGDVSIADIQDGFPVETLKAKTAQAYLSWHKLVDSGIKAELLRRVRDHLKFRKDGSLKDEYPASSFSISCNGAVCQGDAVLFKHFEDPTIAARVISVSRQCRNFTLEVLWSEGTAPREPFSTWKYLWRHIEQLEFVRQPAEDEQRRERDGILNHSRFLRLAETRDKETNPGRRQQRAPEESPDNDHDPIDSVPDVLIFKDCGPGPSRALVPCQSNHVARTTDAASDEHQDGSRMYSGRVLDFSQSESAVEEDAGGSPGEGDLQIACVEGSGVNEAENENEMFSGRVLDFGNDGQVEVNALSESEVGQEEKKKRGKDAEKAGEVDKKRKRENDAECGTRRMYTGRVIDFGDTDAVVETGGRRNSGDAGGSRRRESQGNEGAKKQREQESQMHDDGEVLNFCNSESRNQKSASEALRQPHSQPASSSGFGTAPHMAEMYTGRVLDFGDTEPVVLDVGSQEHDHQNACVDAAGRENCDFRTRDHQDQSRSNGGILTVNKSAVNSSRKKTEQACHLGSSAPKSTTLYKQRPHWEKKWNPQCHVQCGADQCRKNAARRCAVNRCFTCCDSPRCDVHRARDRT